MGTIECSTVRRMCDVCTMPIDEDFDLLLDAYAAGPRLENPDFADVDIEIGPKILAKIEQKHGLTADDVTDIVKGQPPAVEEVLHPDDDEKRQFYGFTRHGRAAFVVGVWAPSTTGRRRLRIVTAFLPDEDDYFQKVRR
jgi:hypothetical protein